MSQIVTQVRSPSGPPNVAFHSVDLPSSPGPDEVVIRLLAAPVNPLDLLVLGDKYPVKPSYTHPSTGQAILGYDGVGEVLSTGPNVSSVSTGDLVVPATFGTGTWRTHAVLPAASVQRLAACPADLAFAAVLRIGVCPAFFLLEDMAVTPLKPGDWIILNAATSLVAQFVAQFAARRGLHVAAVVRDRPQTELKAARTALTTQLGIALVFSESELANSDALKDKPVVLALDSVFGDSGRALMKSLSTGGTYVQLGFLGGPSAQVTLDPVDLFARQVTMKGFRGTAQMALRSPDQQRRLCDWFVELFNRGELKLPVLGLPRVEWDVRDRDSGERNVLDAVERARKGDLGQRKQILVFKH